MRAEVDLKTCNNVSYPCSDPLKTYICLHGIKLLSCENSTELIDL